MLRFPADQVILLDQKPEYDARFDDLMKTMKLPAWQAQELAGQATPSDESIATSRTTKVTIGNTLWTACKFICITITP